MMLIAIIATILLYNELVWRHITFLSSNFTMLYYRIIPDNQFWWIAVYVGWLLLVLMSGIFLVACVISIGKLLVSIFD